MSWFDYQWGHTAGKEEGRREGYAEANRQSNGSSNQGLAVILLFPAIEAIWFGLLAYGLISGLERSSTFSLNLHPIFGILAGLLGACLWFQFFTLPIVGSILNVIMSTIWCTWAWTETNLGWGILVFFISLGMHSLLDDFMSANKNIRKERFTIILCSIIFLTFAAYIKKDNEERHQRKVEFELRRQADLNNPSEESKEASIMIGTEISCEKEIAEKLGKNSDEGKAILKCVCATLKKLGKDKNDLRCQKRHSS